VYTNGSAMLSFVTFVSFFSEAFLTWGWFLILLLALWIAWETYMFIKRIDYVSSIKWTFLQITIPEEAGQTPKAMETAFEVWGGIHKDPDLIERFFDGYTLAWYSCELQCRRGRVRYIMVVPTAHARFFEGVIYGQYSTAEVQEVEDYSLEFSYQDLGKTFELFGTEMHLAKDDYYPIRLYHEYEDKLAEDDRFVDPHQSLLEAYSNIEEGEEFWVQILIRPVSAKEIEKWADTGQEKISALSGQAKEEKPGIISSLSSFFLKLPLEILDVFMKGPLEAGEKKKEERKFHIYNPSEDAAMKGILQKVSHTGFRTKIRVLHIAPAGKLNKPNIGKAIGAFKQFNTFNLNSLKPDSATKTNGPNFIMKKSRRAYRQRVILLNYQWRDFWGDKSGQMLTAEELATLYHFPAKYVRVPAVQRATAGLGSPPENLPYT
jgi:hypothetical protein